MSFLIAHPTSPVLDRWAGAADLCVCLSVCHLPHVPCPALLRPDSGGAELEATAGGLGGAERGPNWHQGR